VAAFFATALSFDRALGATDLLFDFRAALAFVIFLVFDFALFDFALFAVFDLPAPRFDADLDFPRLTGFFMIPPASAAKRHIGSSFASLAREALAQGTIKRFYRSTINGLGHGGYWRGFKTRAPRRRRTRYARRGAHRATA
jgi:hypothetical protein